MKMFLRRFFIFLVGLYLYIFPLFKFCHFGKFCQNLMSNFEEAHDITGHGKFNRLALVTNGFILLYVTMECLGLGYVLTRAECDLHISVTDRGMIASSTLLGVVSPAIIWGYVADVYGRRSVMLPSMVLTLMLSFTSSLAVNFWSIFVLRLLTGVLISASCATAYVYLGELHIAKHRPTAIAWGSAFIALSYFTMPAFAWAIMGGDHWTIPVFGELSVCPWRIFMWSWLFWGICAVVGLCILPESPRFVLATKGPHAVIPILAKIYAWNYNKKPSEYPVTEIVSTAHEGPRPTFLQSLKRMQYMLKPPLLKCVVISHFCNFLVFMQSNAFYVWMPHLVNELLHSESKEVSMCYVMNQKYENETVLKLHECHIVAIDNCIYPISMMVGVLTAIMYVSIGILVVKCGKKRVFCSIMIVCSCLILTACLIPHTYVAIGMLIPGMCGITANTVLATVAVDVFPTSLRALSLCTLFMVGRMGAALGADFIAIGLQGNCVPVVLMMTVLTGASSLLMILWPDARVIRAKMEAKDFTY